MYGVAANSYLKNALVAIRIRTYCTPLYTIRSWLPIFRQIVFGAVQRLLCGYLWPIYRRKLVVSNCATHKQNTRRHISAVHSQHDRFSVCCVCVCVFASHSPVQHNVYFMCLLQVWSQSFVFASQYINMYT